jgi:hypothetical protein
VARSMKRVMFIRMALCCGRSTRDKSHIPVCVSDRTPLTKCAHAHRRELVRRASDARRRERRAAGVAGRRSRLVSVAGQSMLGAATQGPAYVWRDTGVLRRWRGGVCV